MTSLDQAQRALEAAQRSPHDLGLCIRAIRLLEVAGMRAEAHSVAHAYANPGTCAHPATAIGTEIVEGMPKMPPMTLPRDGYMQQAHGPITNRLREMGCDVAHQQGIDPA